MMKNKIVLHTRANRIFTKATTLGAAADPHSYWLEAASHLRWQKPFESVLPRGKEPLSPWFPKGAINLCDNALDRHVDAGHGDKVALIYDSPVTSTVKHFTYRELLTRVSSTGNMLRDMGVGVGDKVVIYMPMVPEAVEAMLACARIGAVHSVVFGGFAAAELAKRIADCRPKVILSASCGIEGKKVIDYKELLDNALKQLPSDMPLPKCLILQRPHLHCKLTPSRDVCWSEVHSISRNSENCPLAVVPSEQTAYILYTSGTTGGPKGLERSVGGYATMLKNSMSTVYGVSQRDKVFTASDIGWIVGHSYIVYGPLLQGATTVLFEGKPVGTPDPGTFWRIVEEHSVNMLFTAPTALRAIKQMDPNGEQLTRYNTTSLRHLFLAGERSDPDSLQWAAKLLNVPVVDHWWQTETGAAMTSSPFPYCHDKQANMSKFGSAGCAVPGWGGLAVINSTTGEVLPPNTLGDIVLKLPLPPGAISGMYNRPIEDTVELYMKTPGWFATFDAGLIDEDGFVHVMTRTDDIINVAGHRLPTGTIEEVIASHPDVAEGAVVGRKCPLKGERPVVLFVLKTGRTNVKCAEELVDLVRTQVGAIATPTAFQIDKLPKTRSGKVLRKVIRTIVNGEQPSVPATIENPQAVEELLIRFGTAAT